MNSMFALGRVGGGLLAGLVGGLAMSLVMLMLRTVVGISPPLEMIPDRFAPTLTIDQFFGLIGRFGGYNELKQFGVSSRIHMANHPTMILLACCAPPGHGRHNI